MRVGNKWKKPRNICKRNVRYRFWTRLLSWLVTICWATITQRIEFFFSNFRVFLEKIDRVILLDFKCTINPQNFIKIIWKHFWENQNIKIFHMWTTLNFSSKSELKKIRDGNICKWTLDMEFKRDWSFGLGTTLGDSHREN